MSIVLSCSFSLLFCQLRTFSSTSQLFLLLCHGIEFHFSTFSMRKFICLLWISSLPTTASNSIFTTRNLPTNSLDEIWGSVSHVLNWHQLEEWVVAWWVGGSCCSCSVHWWGYTWLGWGGWWATPDALYKSSSWCGNLVEWGVSAGLLLGSKGVCSWRRTAIRRCQSRKWIRTWGKNRKRFQIITLKHDLTNLMI